MLKRVISNNTVYLEALWLAFNGKFVKAISDSVFCYLFMWAEEQTKWE